MKNLSEQLLNKLACPICKNKLEYEEKDNRLICRNCLVKYPIMDGIPVLLATDGEKIK